MDDSLATLLRNGMNNAFIDVARIADRTKIPAATIRHFLGEEVLEALPARVYLRGQVAVLARELKLEERRVLAAFDLANPPPPTASEAPERRYSSTSVALVAGLGGIAILAVILAFASTLN